MKQVIICGHLFDVKEKKFREGVNVYIDGNIIKRIDDSGAEPEPGWDVVDLRGKYVMPGFIDCHVHLNMNGEPDGAASMAMATDGDMVLKAYVYAMRDLMAGFTGVRDEGASGFTDIALRNMIEQGVVKGPRIFCSGMPLGTTGGHADSHFNPYITGRSSMGIVVDGPDAGRAAARENFKRGADQIKLMATGGVMSVGDDPGSPEFTMEEMKAICDEAKQKGKLTSAHTHGALGIKWAIEAGVDTIEHGTMLDDEGLQMMLEHGSWLVPTLCAPYNIMKHGVEAGIPKHMVDKCATVAELHKKSVRRAYEAGVKIAFGTDTATPFSTHGSQALEFELLVDDGFTPEDAILSATINAAEMLRWDHKVGSVEEGKLADLVAVDSDPIADICVLKNVSFVMKDGEIFKQ
ncbi:MAG: amidohydrolase family protein [Hungatella sp.]|jgi:imidazolonepropionase-like amidohydrolase|nr:amidohydrolase family protein [Hungatella sp.]